MDNVRLPTLWSVAQFKKLNNLCGCFFYFSSSFRYSYDASTCRSNADPSIAFAASLRLIKLNLRQVLYCHKIHKHVCFGISWSVASTLFVHFSIVCPNQLSGGIALPNRYKISFIHQETIVYIGSLWSLLTSWIVHWLNQLITVN